MRSFLGITTHLIQDGKLKTSNILYCLHNFKLKLKTYFIILLIIIENIDTVELFESHTAIYIGHTLIETLQSWGIEAEKVVAVVTDSGENMEKAIVEEFGAKKHIPCPHN